MDIFTPETCISEVCLEYMITQATCYLLDVSLEGCERIIKEAYCSTCNLVLISWKSGRYGKF